MRNLMPTGGSGRVRSSIERHLASLAISVFTISFLAAACSTPEARTDSERNPGDQTKESAPEDFTGDYPDEVVESPTAVATPLTEFYEFKDLAVGGGGWVTGMVIHPSEPDLMYVRTDVGGAYRWDPAAERWIQLLQADTVPTPRGTDWQVSSLVTAPSDPDRVYLAVGGSFRNDEGRILASTDRGETWSDGGRGFVIAGNSENRIGGERLAADPANPDVVWFGSRTEGLLVSSDGAQTWTTVDSLAVESEDSEEPTGVKWVIASEFGTYIGVAGVGVFEIVGDPLDPDSLTANQLWGSEGVPLDAEMAADGVLWVAEQKPPFVYRYDTETSTYIDVSPGGGKKFASVAIDPNNPDLVMIGRQNISRSGLWRTTDSGESWTQVASKTSCEDIPWLDVDHDRLLSAGSMAFDLDGELWFPEGFGVWRTTDLEDREVTFECETFGIEELVSNDVLVTPAGSVVTAHWDRGAFRHLDGTPAGAVQGPVSEFNSVWDIDWSPADPDFVVAVVADHRFCCEDSSDAYASSYSTDGGQTWTRFGSYSSGSHPYELRFGDIAVAANDTANLVWLPTFNSPPQFSRDRGDTWTSITLPGTDAEDFHPEGVDRSGSHSSLYLNRNVLVADRVLENTFYLYHAKLGLLRSTDGGENWTLLPSTDLPTGWPMGFFNAQMKSVPGEAGHLIFSPGLINQGIWPAYESLDGGETWTVIAGTGNVTSFGFGAPERAGGAPTYFLAGEINGENGLWRSTDEADSWNLVSEAPEGNYLPIRAVTGDPTTFGTVYVAFGGTTAKVGRSAE